MSVALRLNIVFALYALGCASPVVEGPTGGRQVDVPSVSGTDAVASPDLGKVLIIGDTGAPIATDTTPPPDIATPDPGQAQDVAPDVTVWVDAGPCGQCPSDRPLCVNGGCLCTSTSCPKGALCDGGACAPCTSSTACGPSCESCVAKGLFCKSDGSACVACEGESGCAVGAVCVDGVCTTCTTAAACGPSCKPCPSSVPCVGGKCIECLSPSVCGAGKTCDDGTCVACTPSDPKHCGSGCTQCGGAIPECASGKCVCNATSCGAGAQCLSGQCTTCASDSACGPSCAPCAAGTHCKGGACVQCVTATDCGAAHVCEATKCLACTASDAAHCGATCAVCAGKTPQCLAGACSCTATSCGAGAQCQAGACAPCTTAAACGTKCTPCGAGESCAGGACVQCTKASDCTAPAACESGKCVACTDADAQHCGPACATCTGTTPACVGGACACTAGSCGAGSQCQGAACVGCTTAAACGPTCGACDAAKPHCGGATAGCVACLSNDHCTGGNVCTGNACVPPCGDVQGCATNVTTSGEKCGTAWVIGRKDALTTAGFKKTADTTNANDDDNLSTNDSDCWDAQGDHMYRIWLIAGETLKVTSTPSPFDFDLMMKFYVGVACKSGGSPVFCTDAGYDGKAETFTHVAAVTGWHTIVVDGRMAFSDDYDYGPYTLVAKLTGNKSPQCCL